MSDHGGRAVRGARHAEWLLLCECLRPAGGAAHTAVELAEGLAVRPERMRANLDLTGGQIVTERITAVLTPRTGKATARRCLTLASVLADRDGRPLAEILTELPELKDAFADGELAGLLDPDGCTGAAGLLVDRALGGQPDAAGGPRPGPLGTWVSGSQASRTAPPRKATTL